MKLIYGSLINVLFVFCLAFCLSSCDKSDKKNYNTAENMSKINHYFDVTLPKSGEIIEYYHLSNSSDEILEARVDIDKSDYDDFVNSIKDYYEDSYGIGTSDYADKSWWSYKIDDVVDYYEIMKIPKTTYGDWEKLTAYEMIVIVENGKNYSLFMAYSG